MGTVRQEAPYRVGFDMDGVLADFAWGFTLTAEEMFGTPVSTAKDWHAWSASEVLGITRRQAKNVYAAMTDEVWRNLPSLFSERTEARLIQLGNSFNYELVIITARYDLVEDITKQWLRDRNIKAEVHFRDDKGAACMELGVHTFLDDKPKHAEAVRDAGIHAFTMDWPYCEDSPGIHMVRTIGEYLDEVRFCFGIEEAPCVHE